MQAVAQPPSPRASCHQLTASITTSLYDLMQAIHEEVSPGEERLVTEVVVHLLDSGRIHFIGDPHRPDAS